VRHGIDKLPAVVDGPAATRLGGGDERSKQLPPGIGQVDGEGAAGEVAGGILIVDGIGQPRIIRAFQTPSNLVIEPLVACRLRSRVVEAGTREA